MKIDIEYEASWRNSFLDGNNNEVLPKKGRKYIASSTNLKKKENFIERTVTLNTVMGLLSRLIGDQRKLYQARKEEGYYFEEFEDKISYIDNTIITSSELVYLRNMLGSTDQNSYTGAIKTDDEMFTSDYSQIFWSVLTLDIDELLDYIINDSMIRGCIDLDPISISNRFDEIAKIKPIDESEKEMEALKILEKYFEGTNYKNNKDKVVPLNLYCSALYLQLERLSSLYDLSSALTKNGTITGISKRSFTKKDFMNRFTTGEKKKIFGNPYISVSYPEGGKVTSMLTKASGTLKITLDISRDKAIELKQLIENAGVSSFYLGKKGLAYVTNIDTREVS